MDKPIVMGMIFLCSSCAQCFWWSYFNRRHFMLISFSVVASSLLYQQVFGGNLPWYIFVGYRWEDIVQLVEDAFACSAISPQIELNSAFKLKRFYRVNAIKGSALVIAQTLFLGWSPWQHFTRTYILQVNRINWILTFPTCVKYTPEVKGTFRFKWHRNYEHHNAIQWSIWKMAIVCFRILAAAVNCAMYTVLHGKTLCRRHNVPFDSVYIVCYCQRLTRPVNIV